MTTFSRYAIIAGLIGAAALALVGYRTLQNKIYRPEAIRSVSGVAPTAQTIINNESASAPHASSSVPSLKADGTGSYQIEALPLSQSAKAPAIPSLDRAVIFPASFPAEARKVMSDKINATAAVLKKDPQKSNEWLALAVFRKTIDDFEGARDIWEFLAAGNPQSSIPFANLANLYAFELKDPARAEENFIKAMQKDPNAIILYRQAYEFYRYVRKDDVKAKETLQKGIAQTKSPDLQYLSDHYSEL